jgi:mRNA interferase MazF
MVTSYVPDAGDIVMMDFDPQVGREPTKRRPALVLTDQCYKRASGLAVVCPLTSKRKPHPFLLPITIDKVEGAPLIESIFEEWLQLRRRAPLVCISPVPDGKTLPRFRS